MSISRSGLFSEFKLLDKFEQRSQLLIFHKFELVDEENEMLEACVQMIFQS